MTYGERKDPGVDKSALFAIALADGEKAGADAAKLEQLAEDWMRACRDEPAPYRRLVKIRVRRRNIEGAREIALRGLERFPSDEPLQGLAGNAETMADAGALTTFVTRAAACRAAGEGSAGLAIVEEGLARFPDDALEVRRKAL